MIIAKQAIYDQQKKWATGCGVPFDAKGYTQTVEENLFRPLTAGTQADFSSGRGNEMGSVTQPGKMQALHSSSALVCNVFDYWRSQLLLGQSLSALTTALGAPDAIKQMRFEQTYPTGLGGTAPHLDVALLGDTTKPFLIESKFTEPYGPGNIAKAISKNSMPSPYFPDSVRLWEERHLPYCEALAKDISHNRIEFFRLDAPQLLKHTLGLAKKFQKDFTLLYLWYDYPSSEAAEHRAEVETFMLRLNGEIDFRVMTYQELFRGITITTGGGYVAYLAERYF